MFSWVSLLVFSGGGWEKKRKQAARFISGSSNSHCSLLPICFYLQELRGTIAFAVLSGVCGRHENQNKAHVGKQNTVGHFLNHNIGFDPDPWVESELTDVLNVQHCGCEYENTCVLKVESRWRGLYDAEQKRKWMRLSVEVEIITNILISYTFEGILSWHIELWCSCGISGFESGFTFFVLSLFFFLITIASGQNKIDF